MTTRVDVIKNVHLMTIDVSQTTPHMDQLTTNLVLKHKGEYAVVANHKQYVIFREHDDLTAFLNEWGSKVNVTDVKVVK